MLKLADIIYFDVTRVSVTLPCQDSLAGQSFACKLRAKVWATQLMPGYLASGL